MAEEIYQNLTQKMPRSVHLCDFPSYDASLVDDKLEADMGAVLSIVTAGRAARNAANIKNRQPLAKMFVQAKTGTTISLEYLDIVKEELNIKAVEPIDDASGMVGRKIKPNLKVLGPKYGKILPKIGAELASGDGNELWAALQADGITLTIDGSAVYLTMDDVLVEDVQQEGMSAQMQDGFLVVLDTTLTDELVEEGFVREIISKIQTMRKEAGFEVMDKITVSYKGSQTLHDIIAKNADYICGETQAITITQTIGEGFNKQWDINGENTQFWVTKQ